MTSTGELRPGDREVLSDDEALRALRSRDEAGTARVVAAFTPAMLRLARTRVATESAAEDAVQDAWIAVLRGVDRFEGRSSLRTWVLGVVLNTARRTGTREGRVLPFSAAWRADRDEGAVTATLERFAADGTWISQPVRWDLLPEEQLSAGELARLVDDAVARLPLRQRAVLTARDVLLLDADDVTALFGLSGGNQRVLLHRARCSVRNAVESYALGDAVGGPASPGAGRGSRPPPPRAAELLRRRQQPLACRELVALVDDYLEGELHPELRRRVEEHLASCDTCSGYVAQVTRLLDLTGQLAQPSPALLRRLTDALRRTSGPR